MAENSLTVGLSSTTEEALGQSEVFLEFQERLSLVAQVNRPVLVIGERGTGKELAAARLHYLSSRWEGPFVTLNCATLSPALIEAELFGHEAGAFTGATKQRMGRFEAAHNGTLFLDEIGQIPLEAQEKILRAVEYGNFERVGSSQPIAVDVRIIGATNADLKALAAEGKFKPDLLDRLSFEVLFLPPLRERREDIFLLANHFAVRMAFELGKEDVPQFSDTALALLDSYAWPGNIRELKNVVERAVYRAANPVIHESDIVLDPFQSPYQSMCHRGHRAPISLTRNTRHCLTLHLSQEPLQWTARGNPFGKLSKNLSVICCSAPCTPLVIIKEKQQSDSASRIISFGGYIANMRIDSNTKPDTCSR